MPIARPSATQLPRILVGALVFAAALPVVVLVVSRTGRSYLPLGDFGVLDLRLRDVFSTQTPLTGVYSRYGWNHPGPLFYYLLTPLSLITGHAAWATQVGAGLLQGAAVIWGGILAYRRLGAAVAAGWLVIVGMAYGSTGAWVVLQPWNPNVALPWFALYLLLCWVIATQAQPRDFLAALAVLTLLVQLHVGYAPFALVGVVALIAAVRSSAWSTLTGSAKRRLLLGGLAIIAVLWLPVVIDAVLYPPGNGWRIVKYFFGSHPDQQAVGFSYAARLLARPFAWRPPWLGAGDSGQSITSEAQTASAWWLLLPVAALLAAGYAGHRRGQRSARTAVLLAGAALLVGYVTMSRVTKPAIPYLFYWRLVLGPLVLGTAIGVLAYPLRTRTRERQARGALAVAVAVTLGLTIPVAVGVAHDTTDAKGAVPVLRTILADLSARGLPDQPVLIRFAGSPLLGIEGGLINEIDRHSDLARVDLMRASQFGRQRAVGQHQVKQVWIVVEEGEILSQLGGAPHAEVLARATPLSAGDEAKLESLQRQVIAQLVKRGQRPIISGLDDPLAGILLARVAGLPRQLVENEEQLSAKAGREGVCRCAVVAFPADRVPVILGS